MERKTEERAPTNVRFFILILRHSRIFTEHSAHYEAPPLGLQSVTKSALLIEESMRFLERASSRSFLFQSLPQSIVSILLFSQNL